MGIRGLEMGTEGVEWIEIEIEVAIWMVALAEHADIASRDWRDVPTLSDRDIRLCPLSIGIAIGLRSRVLREEASKA